MGSNSTSSATIGQWAGQRPTRKQQWPGALSCAQHSKTYVAVAMCSPAVPPQEFSKTGAKNTTQREKLARKIKKSKNISIFYLYPINDFGVVLN
ncbi:hypothetical protein IB237_23895 [Agrobacterium sp. AGB01]|uniref:hypothetical protein n=1 Tax=Agrobacterium sp. AGB01 TaxID=2769302 RepID=UPI0017802F42|nr:hypothetical protein [Agrobacterium sp. AGB01]MBD9390247.1 hypothetical protein [Agrobacterium sp. AGB01]